MKGLEGKRVVVTGGASGIGLAIVERFLEERARVAVIDWSEEGCARLAARDLPLVGIYRRDVADPAAVEATFAELDRLWGAPDVLVNNAGISIRHDFLAITVEEWRRVNDVNLNGVFWVAQAAARRMTKNGAGVILNMGSVNGLVGLPYYADYNAAKAGVISLTRSMALELAPKIRVNVVCPGYILTPMQEAEYTPAMLAECESKVPLRRLGRPAEIAALYAFLASDEASFITGQSFVADGGEICGGLASR